MRLLASALIVLASLGWSAAPSEARTRDQAQAQSRQGTPQASRASATRAAAAPQRREAASRSATSRQATSQRTPARDARGTRQASTRSAASARDARGTRQAAARSGTRQQQAAVNCRGRNCAPRTRAVSWQGGLEPATNAQAHACPTGTLATLAHGHSDIVRCMPL
ncbi:hypothetical protein [Roseomonas fluvialis]|nr:hypothetical protein [Roseomonas fluvialis]